MAEIIISARGFYCVFINGELVDTLTTLEAAMQKTAGYVPIFGWDNF